LNRALMAVDLVDRVQVTLFPVITGQTGLDPIFQRAAEFDLELLENRTLGRAHPRGHLPTHPSLTWGGFGHGGRPCRFERPTHYERNPGGGLTSAEGR
jgi:hypothetical protein